MRYAFIQDHRREFPLGLLCAVLRVSRSGFHGWLKRDHDAKAARRAALVSSITAAHEESRKAYGSPRILRALK